MPPKGKKKQQQASGASQSRPATPATPGFARVFPPPALPPGSFEPNDTTHAAFRDAVFEGDELMILRIKTQFPQWHWPTDGTDPYPKMRHELDPSSALPSTPSSSEALRHSVEASILRQPDTSSAAPFLLTAPRESPPRMEVDAPSVLLKLERSARGSDPSLLEPVPLPSSFGK